MCELAEGSIAIQDWRDGTVFTYQDDYGELAIGVGTFCCRNNISSEHENPQGPGATDLENPNEHFSGCFVRYGENLTYSLKENHNCNDWKKFLEDLSKVLKTQPSQDFCNIHKVSTDLLYKHKVKFAKNFNNAANYEYVKWRLGCQQEAKHWKRSFIQKVEAWISKQSEHGAQMAGLQDEKAMVDVALSKQTEYSRELESKLKTQQKEIVCLRRDLSEYREHLGRASYGLTNINIANEAHFPSANEVLQRYDQLVSQLMEIYDDSVYDENSGKPDMMLQLEFGENLCKILKGVWGVLCSRYTQLVGDLCCFFDLIAMSTASIQKCNEHCRQHWEPLFMPTLAGIIKDHGVESDAKPASQQKQDLTASKEACEMSPIPKHAIMWFLNNIDRDLLPRMWETIVLLFLQRPVLGVLPEESVTVRFDSNKYSTHDDIKLREKQQVIALLPPVYCAPNNMDEAKLGFEGCHSVDRTILRKGTVDQLGLE